MRIGIWRIWITAGLVSTYFAAASLGEESTAARAAGHVENGEPSEDVLAPAVVVEGSSTAATVAGDEEQSPAVLVVNDLNDALLEVLKQSNELDYAGRFSLLEPSLKAIFDLQYMARQAVGRGFLDLSQEDRALWYSLFSDYMVSNYAARFDHYANQQFEIVGEEPGTKDTVLVRTQVIDPGKETVDLSYRLRGTGDEWKVIDVYLKGSVSELALRRSEYAGVLKREGFTALVTKVRAKIGEAANDASPIARAAN